MSEITMAGSTNSGGLQVNPPGLAVLQPPTNANRAGLVAGEAIKQGAACYINSDGTVYRSKQNLNAAPSAPTCSSTASGTGLFNGGTLIVTVTYVTAYGESTPSVPAIQTITTTGSLRIAAVTGLDTSITKMNVYVNGTKLGSITITAGDGSQTDFNGASLTLNGTPPPTVNTAYKDAAWQVDGFAATQAFVAGEAITLWDGVLLNYATSLTPGAKLYVSASTAGGLATVSSGTQTHAAEVFDATRILIKRVKA